MKAPLIALTFAAMAAQNVRHSLMAARMRGEFRPAPKASGSRLCTCGRTISANKQNCLACATIGAVETRVELAEA